MQSQNRIFDAHFHIGAYAIQAFEGHAIQPIPPQLDHASLVDCERYIERHRITRGVIVPTYLEDQTAAFDYNRIILGSISSSEALYGGLWVSPLEEVEPLLNWTLKQLPHPGIRALKIASNTWRPYSIDPATWTAPVKKNVEHMLDVAKAHNLIIHFHTGYLPGADPLEFAAFLDRYGHAARYQLVHMGEAIAPAFRFVPRFIEWIEAGYDVYTDSSIVPAFAPAWMVEELDRHNLPCDRVFFATDSPWGRFESEYWKIEGMDVSQEIKKRIFWENAACAYFADE